MLFRAKEPRCLKACRHQLEGIVAKKTDSPYLFGKRFRSCLKSEARHVTSCYIACVKMRDGYWSDSIGALVPAEARNGPLCHCGRAGTELSGRPMSDILKRLGGLRSQCPMSAASRLKDIRWFRPKSKCGVIYYKRTPGGHLRIPVFQKLAD